MNKKSKKALRNLKVGGIYTPIVFGIIFLMMNPWLNFIDPSGDLSAKLNGLPFYSPPTMAIGGALLFWGINSYIYFMRYMASLDPE